MSRSRKGRGHQARVLGSLAVLLVAILAATGFPQQGPPAGSSNLIVLRTRSIDPAQPPAVPASMAFLPTTGRQLQLVQFAGPIQDEWLDSLKRMGDVEVLAYVPHNAYLVWADQAVFNQVAARAGREQMLRTVLPYAPLYKFDSSLSTAAAARTTQEMEVTVQLVTHPGVQGSIDALRGLASSVGEPRQVGRFTNMRATVTAAEARQIAQRADVLNVERWVEPRLYGERQDQILAGNLNAAGSQPSGPGYLAWLNGLGFTGTFGFTVDITDSGIDRGSTAAANLHQDFLDAGGNSRVTYARRVSGTTIDNTPANNVDTIGHGTIDHAIVAGFNNTDGSAAFEDGDGYQYGLGVAPFARIGSSQIFSPIWTSPDFTTLQQTAFQAGARVSSNSWGATFPTGAYDATSQEYDALVRDADPAAPGNQEMVIVFAAGNNGPGSSTVGDRGSTSKNTLVVGASENFNATGDADGCGVDDTGANSVQDIIGFSSRGPVATSGRVKPDIVAPGTHVFGAASQAAGFSGAGVCGGPSNDQSPPPTDAYYPAGQTLYTWSSGTSHACPAVAGGAALLRQWFIDQGLGPAPSPAMTKAYLVNAARYLDGTGAGGDLPSNSQGFGLMDLGRGFDGAARMLEDQGVTFGGIGASPHVVTGNIQDETEPFRVTLAWTDEPGTPITGGALVNDLDLTVEVGSGSSAKVYRGNNFNGAHSQEGGASDGTNNVESVFLPAGTCGEFTVTVTPAAINGDGVPNNADTTDQDFALVIYNGDTGPGCDGGGNGDRPCGAMSIVDPGSPFGPAAYLLLLLAPLVFIVAWRVRLRAARSRRLVGSAGTPA